MEQVLFDELANFDVVGFFDFVHFVNATIRQQAGCCRFDLGGVEKQSEFHGIDS